MKIYNSLSKTIEEFKPLNPPLITFYSCGPTVYNATHIGHLRTYINIDVLKRALLYFGYEVKHIINITDVGHLTGDDDTGEDKLEKEAKEIGKSVSNIANFYTDFFIKSLSLLNIIPPFKYIKATDHIQEMIDLIKKIESKGFTYETDEAVYFNTTKFDDYGKLSGQKLCEKKQGVRDEVIIDPQKKNPTDFALWFKTVKRFKDHVLHWPSPWGEGFPGWHIECSAMSMKYLGETLDIHAGGVDHLPVHHENEIAQSESATDKQFVKYWVHNEFLLINDKKMSKSLKNIFTIEDVQKKRFETLSLRYLCLQTHYRQQMNFTWESLESAENAYKKLKETVIALKKNSQVKNSESDLKNIDYKERFNEAISNDLQIPQALSIMWEMLKSKLNPNEKLDLLLSFDKIFGLSLESVSLDKIPSHILELAKERQAARSKGDFKKSDELRKQINKLGFEIEDLKKTFELRKSTK
jgi:cysteinyl-tRNA synthetase